MVIDECHSFKSGNIVLEGKYPIEERLGWEQYKAKCIRPPVKTVGTL